MHQVNTIKGLRKSGTLNHSTGSLGFLPQVSNQKSCGARPIFPIPTEMYCFDHLVSMGEQCLATT